MTAILGTFLVATFMIACGGGGGGGSAETTTFNGVVFDAALDEAPAPSATVELWQAGSPPTFEDDALTDADGVFSLVGSDIVGEDIFFKTYKDPDHVPFNTQLHTVPAAGAFAGTIYLPLLSEVLVAELGSAVWGTSMSSWNSTAQGFAYVVFDVERSAQLGTSPGGVTVLEDTAGTAIFDSTNLYYGQVDGTYTTTNMTSSLNDSGFPGVVARTDTLSAATMFSFTTTNHPDGNSTVDAYLMPGEITEVILYDD